MRKSCRRVYCGNCSSRRETISTSALLELERSVRVALSTLSRFLCFSGFGFVSALLLSGRVSGLVRPSLPGEASLLHGATP